MNINGMRNPLGFFWSQARFLFVDIYVILKLVDSKIKADGREMGLFNSGK